VTFAMIRAHDQARVVEFFVITLIINLATTVATGGLTSQGASSTCQVSRTPPSLGPFFGIYPRERALILSLDKEDFDIPVFLSTVL
jgi:hypothetical protein